MGACCGGPNVSHDNFFESSDEEGEFSKALLVRQMFKTEEIASCVASFVADWEALHAIAFEVGEDFRIDSETLKELYNQKEAQEEWLELMDMTIANMSRLHTFKSVFMHSVHCRYTVPWDDQERQFKSTFTSQVKSGVLQELYWMIQDPDRFRRKFEGEDSAYALIRGLLIMCGGHLGGPKVNEVEHHLDDQELENLVIHTSMFPKPFTLVLRDHRSAQFEDNLPDSYVAQTPELVAIHLMILGSRQQHYRWRLPR